MEAIESLFSGSECSLKLLLSSFSQSNTTVFLFDFIRDTRYLLFVFPEQREIEILGAVNDATLVSTFLGDGRERFPFAECICSSFLCLALLAASRIKLTPG